MHNSIDFNLKHVSLGAWRGLGVHRGMYINTCLVPMPVHAEVRGQPSHSLGTIHFISSDRVSY